MRVVETVPTNSTATTAALATSASNVAQYQINQSPTLHQMSVAQQNTSNIETSGNTLSTFLSSDAQSKFLTI